MRLFLLTNVQITSLVSEHLPLLFLRFEFSISVPSDVDLALGFGFFAVSSEIHNHVSMYLNIALNISLEINLKFSQYISIHLLCAKQRFTMTSHVEASAHPQTSILLLCYYTYY